ncbi:MAG: PQQ-binding-like beta-propeller repeat protein [Candidatus Acidiferrales bacterium]
MRYAALIAGIYFVVTGIGVPRYCADSQTLASSAPVVDWPAYGGGPEGSRYSPLQQINRQNVANLQVAWTYDTAEEGGLETSPIIVGGVLYGITPAQEIFALDAATGRQLWKFGSGIEGGQPNRGLSYWANGDDRRILVGITNFVYALDARIGKPINDFGEEGRIDLRKNLRGEFQRQSLVSTIPGVVYKDLIIFGDREPEVLPAPPGDIRAYDVRTGKLRWTFHTIPHPGEFGYETWPKHAWTYSGAANNWAGMALDEKRGIVYVPTGSAASDFYGGDRIGDDLFANSLIALNAETGKRIWHFQSVRHDIWDRDFPSPPSLVTVKHDGRTIDAIAQTTKSGYVYLFDRTNGEPVFPIAYRPYPPSTVPGEIAAATQPLPTRPAPFSRQRLTEDMLTTRTPAAHAWAVNEFRKFRSEGQFVPLGVGRATVVFPGFGGGAEWGGSAVDAEAGILYVNANDVASTGTLVKNTGGQESSGRAIYLSQCSMCHGEKLAGSPPQFPSLVDESKTHSREEISSMIRHGKGRMPAFSNLSGDKIDALIDYVSTGGKAEHASSGEAHEAVSPEPAPKLRYRFAGYNLFLDPDGYPAIAPPWGTLNAIDLNTGEYLWKVPLGEYPALAAKGMKDTGTENYGGPIVTAGGLVFIAATNFDKKMRAFDRDTGKLLWEAVLPFCGNATPVTYEVAGRQYVVIAAGGGKAWDLPSGGVYVAFALPKSAAPPQ